jgi:Family of unknown function (DUF6152)
VKPIRSLRAVAVFAAALCSLDVAPVFAHHSFGLFDMNKTAEIAGTVVRLEWSNPHCWLFLESRPSPVAEAVNYGFEMTSVGEMVRRGWSKSSVKPGDKVKVTFHPVRDGRPAGLMISVMTQDGRYIGRPPENQNPPLSPAATGG